MKKAFVIILNWNGGEMTLRCLKSLQLSIINNQLSIEIVVMDNGSTDGSQEMLRQFKVQSFNKFRIDPERSRMGQSSKFKVHLIVNKKNLGYAEGNNVGIRYALENGADYICLLNNDTRVAPDFLVQLVKVADSDEKIGVVGGKIYFEKGYEFHKERYQKNDLGKVIWYAGGLIDWQNVYASHRGVDEVDHGRSETEIETEYVNGCLMLIKREVFGKVGLLDPKFFMYLEDTDFCVRAKKAGFKIFYAPKSIIWHLNAGSSGPGSNLHDYFITRNRLLFGLRWAPLKSKIALIKESFKLLIKGRKWQKIGVRDFYLGRSGKGSWNE